MGTGEKEGTAAAGKKQSELRCGSEDTRRLWSRVLEEALTSSGEEHAVVSPSILDGFKCPREDAFGSGASFFPFLPPRNASLAKIRWPTAFFRGTLLPAPLSIPGSASGLTGGANASSDRSPHCSANHSLDRDCTLLPPAPASCRRLITRLCPHCIFSPISHLFSQHRLKLPTGTNGRAVTSLDTKDLLVCARRAWGEAVFFHQTTNPVILDTTHRWVVPVSWCLKLM